MATLKDLVLEESTDILEREIKNKPGELNAKIGMLGQSLLHEAAERGKLNSMSTLLRLGANVNAIDKDRGTPLHYASLRGHVPAVEMLLSKGAYHDKQDVDGNFPHHWAAGNNKVAVLEVLLSHPESRTVLKKGNKNGDTILHAAARGEASATIHSLVKSGAQVDAQNKTGDTPLHIAAQSGKLVCVEALLQYVKESKKNESEQLPEDVAANSSIKDLIKGGGGTPPTPASPAAINQQGRGVEVEEDTNNQTNDKALESQEVNQLAEDLSKEKFVESTAVRGEATKTKVPLTKAQKSEAMQHMTSQAREKIQPKSGQQKFLEKYNLTSNKDPMLKKTLLKTEE